MSAKERLGTPVIDELRLCYQAEPSLLVDLSDVKIGDCWIIEPFTLIRTGGDRFEFSYIVCLGEPGDRREVGMLKFGRYGAGESQYIFFKVQNSVLYDISALKLALTFPDMLGMTFNNFTAIDIAIDYPKNISAIIKRMMRNDQITTILNGKAIKERGRTIPGITFDYSTSLRRLHCPTITLRQAKASKNKEKGITVQSYDKKAEIETSSGKGYILDYYQHPRHLFRLEVRLRYQELQDYCKKMGIAQSVELIQDRSFLEGAFFYHLSSVLRFSKGRRPLAWQDIISSTGKV